MPKFYSGHAGNETFIMPDGQALYFVNGEIEVQEKAEVEALSKSYRSEDIGRETEQRNPEGPPVEEEPQEVPDDQGPELQEMNIKELRELAKAEGVPRYSVLSKDELIKALGG